MRGCRKALREAVCLPTGQALLARPQNQALHSPGSCLNNRCHDHQFMMPVQARIAELEASLRAAQAEAAGAQAELARCQNEVAALGQARAELASRLAGAEADAAQLRAQLRSAEVPGPA